MARKRKFTTIQKGPLFFEVPAGKDVTSIRVLVDESLCIATLYYTASRSDWYCCCATYSLPKGLLRTIVDFMDTLKPPTEETDNG